VSSRWVTAPLGDLVENLDRHRVPVSSSERATRPGSVPYYGATGQVGTIDSPLFDEELLLLGEDGVQFFDPHKLKAYRIVGPSWVNNHAHVLRPNPARLDLRFLLHYLNQFDYQGFANGTTRLKLTQSAMNLIPVPIPPLEEQRRIVAILEDHLSHLDAADAGLRKALRQCVQFERSALEAAVHSVPVNVVPLKEVVARIEAGKSFTCEPRVSMPGEWGVVKVSAMTWGRFIEKENKAVPKGKSIDDRFQIRAGDILVSRANTSAYVGSPVLVTSDPDHLLLSDKSLRLIPRPGISRTWLLAVLSAPSTREQISSLATGTKDSMRNVSQDALMSVRIPVPTLVSDQKSVEQMAEDARSGMHKLREDASRSESQAVVLRQSLLMAAFSGQLTKEFLNV
jgi:type I restriction enzyme S subunit